MEIYKDIDWLKLHFCDKKMRLVDIALLAKTSPAQIWRTVIKFGLSRKKLEMNQISREKINKAILAKKFYFTHGVLSSPTSFNYRDKSWLIQKYQVEKLSMQEMSKLCGITRLCILRWMNKFSIPRRLVDTAMEKNGNWTGGKVIRNGYRFIKSPNHPQTSASGYMREHRLVMEKKLKRYLTANEHIHHKDGDKQNNNPDNLELFTNSEHKRYEQTLQLFIKKIMFSTEEKYIVSYRNDLLSRFKAFL